MPWRRKPGRLGCPIEELRTCRNRTASGRADRIDHGRCIIRVGSVVGDDRGAGVHDAPGNPGDDATGRPGHHTTRPPSDGQRSFGHPGSGFGPVAVTRRCGTQSWTWLKPSKRAPSGMLQASCKERR